MTVRRRVLGDARVDRVLRHLAPLNDKFQDFITRCAWGKTWARLGLGHHIRSMITTTTLIALDHEVEPKMHLRASFDNEATRGELKESVMHSTLYYGLPVVNATMYLAQQVFDDIGAAQG